MDINIYCSTKIIYFCLLILSWLRTAKKFLGLDDYNEPNFLIDVIHIYIVKYTE